MKPSGARRRKARWVSCIYNGHDRGVLLSYMACSSDYPFRKSATPAGQASIFQGNIFLKHHVSATSQPRSPLRPLQPDKLHIPNLSPVSRPSKHRPSLSSLDLHLLQSRTSNCNTHQNASVVRQRCRLPRPARVVVPRARRERTVLLRGPELAKVLF